MPCEQDPFYAKRLAALTAGGPEAERGAALAKALLADTFPPALTAAEHATIACVLGKFVDILDAMADQGSADPESDGIAIAELRRLRTKTASIAFAAVSQ